MTYGAPFPKLRTDHRLPSSGTISIMPYRNSQSSHSNTPTNSPPSATCKPALFEIRFPVPHKSIVYSLTCIPAANTRNMHDMSTQEQYYQPLQVVLHRLITYRALRFRFRVVLHQHTEDRTREDTYQSKGIHCLVLSAIFLSNQRSPRLKLYHSPPTKKFVSGSLARS